MPGLDKSITLKDAFNIQHGEVISLVGAGGKTTLMSTLAKELAGNNSRVISTTTTKIFDWQASGDNLIVEKDNRKILDRLAQSLEKYRHITLASERLTKEGKLDGINPEIIIQIAELGLVDCIVIEADGAARKSLKAPNATEPVIPQNTTLVIAIVGIDALGLKLTRENAFRPEIISRLTGLPIGAIITIDTMTTLINHSQGITKGSPPTARIIPFINKMDITGASTNAEILARKILQSSHLRIERVVLGQLVSIEPVLRVIRA